MEAAGRVLERLGHRLVPMDFGTVEAAARASGRIIAGIAAVNLAERAARTRLDLSQPEALTRSIARAERR